MKQRILLTGKDGIDLLQRITTLDFRRLSIGQMQPGLILNPQGKILSYFVATKTDQPFQLSIEFEDQFLDLLEQFTFGERYQIEKTNSFDIQIGLSEIDRIQSMIPKFGQEFLPNGETNPLEINLSNAIHDQKGCYPGQEVIEKIISMGSSPKKLCLVQLMEKNLHPDKIPLDLDYGKLTSFEFPFGLAIVRKTHTHVGTILKGGASSFKVIKS